MKHAARSRTGTTRRRRCWASLCLTIALTILLCVAAAPAAQSCVGDADGSASVNVAELVHAVGNALEGCPAAPSPCNGDADGDGIVEVAEVLLAVGNALDGCPDAAGLVVDVDWLAANSGRTDIQVVDARLGVVDAHIPGAIPLSPYALATRVDGVEFQVVGAAVATATLAAIGLRRDAVLVVYGVPPEFDPTRVVWALSYLGHENVRYLDGGWNAWTAKGGSTAPGPPQPDGSSDYQVGQVRDQIRVTGDWVLEQLGDPPYETPTIQVVDARSIAEFDAGRIPTAMPAPWTQNLRDGLLRPSDELDLLYADLGLDPTRTTVVYCTAGWRASVAWLTLTWLGFEDVRVYDGSWLEWGQDDRFPIERSTFLERRAY